MRKCVRPLRYNKTIDELNDVIALQTDDIVRPSISIPVLNSLTDVDSKIVVGKYMRCTQHGHILRKNSPQPVQYELKDYSILGYNDYLEIVFSQRVYKVIVNVKELTFTNYFNWSLPSTAVIIQDLKLLGIYNLNFVGNVLYLRLEVMPFGLCTFDVYGFY